MRAGVALAVVALVLAGCGIVQPGVPDWVANRQPLDACGESGGGQPEEATRAARECLWEAYQDGRGAELIEHGGTMEGDPLVWYIRVHENGVVETFLDSRQDRFKGDDWARFTCEGLDPPLVVGGEQGFMPTGCESQPIP